MLLYRRTFVSRLLPVIVGPLAVVLACLWLVSHQRVLLGTAIGLGVALYLFASLTVTVTDSALAVHFGPGLIQRRIPLAEIVSCAILRESAWFGQGVTVMRSGTYHNPQGLLEVALAGGKRVRIGSDEPRVLKRVIEQAREASSREQHMVIDTQEDRAA
jgi:hypothetical protein